MCDGFLSVYIVYCRVMVHNFLVSRPWFLRDNLSGLLRVGSRTLIGWFGFAAVALYAWEIGSCNLLVVGILFRWVLSFVRRSLILGGVAIVCLAHPFVGCGPACARRVSGLCCVSL